MGYKSDSDFRSLDDPYQVIHCPDCVIDFMCRIRAFDQKATNYYLNEKRMIMTLQADVEYASATTCRFCHQPCYAEERKVKKNAESKVRDHDHRTGMYPGADHSSCNLNQRKTGEIPIFVHNFRGYDGNLLSPQLVHF